MARLRRGAYPVLLAALLLAVWLGWYCLSRQQPVTPSATVSTDTTPAETTSPPDAPSDVPAAEVFGAKPMQEAVPDEKETAAPAAEETPTITGRVVTGEPPQGVPGFEIALMEDPLGAPRVQIGSVLTDGDGRFEIDATGLKHSAIYRMKPLGYTGYTMPGEDGFMLTQPERKGPFVFVYYPEGATIGGVVRDATPDESQEFIDRFLEAALSGGNEAADAVGRDSQGPWPMANVVVNLRGESVAKQVLTDAEGRFEFTGLPFGEYEIVAEIPPMMVLSESDGVDDLKEKVSIFSARKDVTLTLRRDLVTVTGRITDAYGSPIAGAEVTGTACPAAEVGDIPTFSAVSGADGTYRLRGMAPLDFYRVAGYLVGGNPAAEAYYVYVSISVSANGYVLDRADQPKVLLVAENQIAAGRRFIAAIHKAASLGLLPDDVRPEDIPPEKEGVILPSGHGNTITGVDIVLTRQ